MARKKTKTPEPPRCDAVVPSRSNSDEYDRCKCPPVKGKTLCKAHQRERDRLDDPPQYVICRSFKPTRINEDGSYRKTIYGRTFNSRQEAQDFVHLRWGILGFQARRGHGRVSSVSVERLKDAVKKPYPKYGRR